jgi:hypothetical protein
VDVPFPTDRFEIMFDPRSKYCKIQDNAIHWWLVERNVGTELALRPLHDVRDRPLRRWYDSMTEEALDEWIDTCEYETLIDLGHVLAKYPF